LYFYYPEIMSALIMPEVRSGKKKELKNLPKKMFPRASVPIVQRESGKGAGACLYFLVNVTRNHRRYHRERKDRVPSSNFSDHPEGGVRQGKNWRRKGEEAEGRRQALEEEIVISRHIKQH